MPPRALFQHAIDIDPNYAAAYVGLGDTYQRSLILGWTDQPVETLKRIENVDRTAATKAIIRQLNARRNEQ